MNDLLPVREDFESMAVKDIVTVMNAAHAELKRRGWTLECGREGISAYIVTRDEKATVVR